MENKDQGVPTVVERSAQVAERTTPARRVGRIGLAIINPFSDLMVIYRTGVEPARHKLATLGKLLGGAEQPREILNWSQAVACSGRTTDQLLGLLRSKRLFWWVAMLWTGAAALILLLMLLVAGDLPSEVILRAGVLDGALAMASVVSGIKVLSANYRMWQLVMKRVSLEEGGTFQHYQAEQQVWLQVVSNSSPF